jgi:hypothetical protein
LDHTALAISILDLTRGEFRGRTCSLAIRSVEMSERVLSSMTKDEVERNLLLGLILGMQALLQNLPSPRDATWARVMRGNAVLSRIVKSMAKDGYKHPCPWLW